MGQACDFKCDGCGFKLTRENELLLINFIFLVLVSRQSAALSSAIQHAMPGGKRKTEFLNTRLALPTLLFAEYSMNHEDLFFDSTKWEKYNI